MIETEKTKLRQDYVDKLNELGVWSKYLHNLKKGDTFNSESIKFLNDEETFADFILTSFRWDKSREGLDFWQEIALK